MTTGGEPARPATRRPAVFWAATAVVALVAAYGVVLRAWLMAHTPLDSDQAIVGLMARSILAGHPSTFYWGQAYGGAEPYVVAPVLWLTGSSPAGLQLAAGLLSAVAAALVGLVVAEATRRRFIGLAAGVLAWTWPYALVWNSLRETGFRGVNVVCGLTMVYAALRLGRGGGRFAWGVVLGLAAGVGWWSSPEIAYFVVPAAVLLAFSWARLGRSGRRLQGPWRPAPVAAAVGAAVLGALPWLYTNIGSRFASLRTSSLPSYGGFSYAGRLGVFFRAMLPVQLGLRSVPGGQWTGGPVAGEVLYGLVGAAVVACLVRVGLRERHGQAGAPALAAAGGVLAFPLIYALVPSTGYWVDGRYGVALPLLVVLLAATSWAGEGAPAEARGPRPRHARPTRPAVGLAAVVVCAVVVVAGSGLTVATARADGVPANPSAFFSGWKDPEQTMRAVARGLAGHGIRYAYGGYWTSYVLDYLDPGHLVVSPPPLTHDVVRWPAEAAAVRRAPRPAWLFVAPGRTVAADEAFGNGEPGPGNYTLAQFESFLQGRGVAYSVLRLGVIDAVLPVRRVRLSAP